jgi:hypothetical protein
MSIKELIKNNRKALLREGFKHSTLTMYGKGKRTPTFETAARIAAICGVSVMSIPWRKQEVNKP